MRKALVADKSLSTYAHNVKIITTDHGVVLKGPVKTALERSRVERVAADAAGGVLVKNELTVAAK